MSYLNRKLQVYIAPGVYKAAAEPESDPVKAEKIRMLMLDAKHPLTYEQARAKVNGTPTKLPTNNSYISIRLIKADDAKDNEIINDYRNLGDKLNKKKEDDKKKIDEINKTVEQKLTDNITK